MVTKAQVTVTREPQQAAILTISGEGPDKSVKLSREALVHLLQDAQLLWYSWVDEEAVQRLDPEPWCYSDGTRDKKGPRHDSVYGFSELFPRPEYAQAEAFYAATFLPASPTTSTS